MAVYKYYVSDPVKYADAGLTGTITGLGTDSDGANCYRTAGLAPALTHVATLTRADAAFIGGATDATGYDVADDGYVVVPLDADVVISGSSDDPWTAFVGWNGYKTRFDGGGTRSFTHYGDFRFALSDAELWRCVCPALHLSGVDYAGDGGNWPGVSNYAQGTAATRGCSFTGSIWSYYVEATHYDASFPSGYVNLSTHGSSTNPGTLDIRSAGAVKIAAASDVNSSYVKTNISCASLSFEQSLHLTNLECEGDAAAYDAASSSARLVIYGTMNVGGSATGGGVTTKDGATSATIGGDLEATGEIIPSSSCGLTVGGDVSCGAVNASAARLKCRDLTASGNVKLATLNARDVDVDSDHSTQVTTLTARDVRAGNYAKGTSWSVASLYVNGKTIATTRTSASAVTSLSFAGPTPLPYGDVTRVWQSGGTYTTDMDGTTSAATPGSSDVVYFGTDGIDLGSASFTCAKCYVAANCSVDVAGITCDRVALEEGAEITGYGTLTWIGHTATSAEVLEVFHLEPPARFVAKNCNISD